MFPLLQRIPFRVVKQCGESCSGIQEKRVSLQSWELGDSALLSSGSSSTMELIPNVPLADLPREANFNSYLRGCILLNPWDIHEVLNKALRTFPLASGNAEQWLGMTTEVFLVQKQMHFFNSARLSLVCQSNVNAVCPALNVCHRLLL